MLKNIFIPEKIDSYFFFPKKVVGIDIGKTHIYATKLLYKGKTVSLEKSFSVALESGNSHNYDERAIKALTLILEQVGEYDALHTAISSSVAIFKELKFPFLDRNKIRLVVEFEVEPLLPFSIHDAVIDFIITKQNTEEKSSEVLVAAVQKHHIAHHLNLLERAGVNPDLITLDIFALYGNYLLIPSYAELAGGVALIDMGAYTTTIAYIFNGQLRQIRSLPKGFSSQAKEIAQELHIQPHEAMDQLIRFGFEKNSPSSYLQTTNSIFTDFWQDIAFTLNSFTQQTEQRQTINQILLYGNGASIKGLSAFIAKQLGIPCHEFQIHKLLHNSALNFITTNGISQANTISFCAALISPATENFTLRRKEFAIQTDRSLLIRQLIFATALAICLLLTLTVHTFLQIRKLQVAAHEAEQEVMNSLKEQFKNIPRDDEDLESVVQQAQAEVQREQKLWFAFANPARISFLHYILELTSRIDKEALGFSIDRLDITENTITLTAHVKDHAALIELEKALREPKSKLFKHVEGVDTPDFTMKIRIAS